MLLAILVAKKHLARWLRRAAHVVGYPSFRLQVLADRLDPPKPTPWVYGNHFTNTASGSNATVTYKSL